MRKTLLLFLSISLFLTGCASPNDVVAQDLWVKSSEMSTRGGMTAVYGTLTNNSSQDVVLVGGAAEIAGVVEVHEMSMIGGEMMMQEIDGGLVIPAGKSIVLEPGGNHLMLMMLTDDLEAGEEISVTFDFDGAEDLTIDGIVAKPAEGGDEEYHSDMEMDN
ncbi:MAG: copper chaperone PCu(A)C [Aquiluna sp.]